MVHFDPFPSISSLVQIAIDCPVHFAFAKDFKSNSEGAVISEIMAPGSLGWKNGAVNVSIALSGFHAVWSFLGHPTLVTVQDCSGGEFNYG